MKKLLLLAALASTGYAQTASLKICMNKTSKNIFLRSSCFSSETAVTNMSAFKGPASCRQEKVTMGNGGDGDLQMISADIHCKAGEYIFSSSSYSNNTRSVFRYDLYENNSQKPSGVSYQAQGPSDSLNSFDVTAEGVCCPIP